MNCLHCRAMQIKTQRGRGFLQKGDRGGWAMPEENSLGKREGPSGTILVPVTEHIGFGGWEGLNQSMSDRSQGLGPRTGDSATGMLVLFSAYLCFYLCVDFAFPPQTSGRGHGRCQPQLGTLEEGELLF